MRAASAPEKFATRRHCRLGRRQDRVDPGARLSVARTRVAGDVPAVAVGIGGRHAVRQLQEPHPRNPRRRVPFGPVARVGRDARRRGAWRIVRLSITLARRIEADAMPLCEQPARLPALRGDAKR